LVEVFSHLLLKKAVKNYNTILLLQMLVTDKFLPRGTELCEKPTRAPIVKKLPTFYEIQWFVSVFTRTHHFPHAQPDESSP
jgi:hypothetical protein